MEPDERQALLFDLRMALRKVPAGTLRDLAQPRRPTDELPAQIVADTILKHLLLCRWRIERLSPTGTPPAAR
jgi:hypothetical protein